MIWCRHCHRSATEQGGPQIRLWKAIRKGRQSLPYNAALGVCTPCWLLNYRDRPPVITLVAAGGA